MIDLNKQATQADLAMLVGVSQQAISAMMGEGKLPSDGSIKDLLQAYCQRLRDQAAGRIGAEAGCLDLVQERAALARSQRIAQDLKNSVAKGEYAPIGTLADVLASASSAVVDKFDHLDGALRKSCPDLPEDARDTVMQVIARARNEWIRSTSKLISDQLDAAAAADDLDDDPDFDA